MRTLLVARLSLLCFSLAAPLRSAAETVDVDGRVPAAQLYVPTTYVPGTPLPLVILLHGYTYTAAFQESYMAFTPLAEQYGFLYLRPQGTLDTAGYPFWNATDACCNFYGSSVDDATYLRHLIDATAAGWSVDPRRIFLIGHSNGGFMSYRMACSHADQIAAIASLAGATFETPSACAPSEPVHTLQIHGTFDGNIAYSGGNIFGTVFPGAIETTELFASYNGCALTPDLSSPNLDLVSNLAGAETTVRRYEQGCAPGGSATLWTMVQGVHVPALTAEFRAKVVEFLLAHPKPLAAEVPALGRTPRLIFGVFLFAVAGGLTWRARRARRGRATH